MNQQKYQELLARFMRYTSNDEFELWIVIDRVAEMLGIDVRKMTVAQGEELWAGLSTLITMLLQNGFIAFSFGKPGEVVPWPEQNPKQVMTEIKNKWIEYKGEFPNVGYIVWFYNSKNNP